MHERILSQFRWGMYEKMVNWQGKMVRYKKENVQVRQWKKKGQKRTLYVGDGQRVKNKMYYFTLDVTKNNIADCLLCLKTHKTDLCVKKCLTKLDC